MCSHLLKYSIALMTVIRYGQASRDDSNCGSCNEVLGFLMEIEQSLRGHVSNLRTY